MKNVWLVMIGGLSATAVVAVAALAGQFALASTAAPCTSKTLTIKGRSAIGFCGPATATLMVAGKTYTFRHGFCAEPISNSDSLQLSLGVDVPPFGGPNDNAGQPGFSMDVAKHHTSASVAFAYFGGREIVKLAAITLKGHVPSAGTFKGKTAAITGSWNCHGVIVKS
jgi:hypothetical protein